MSRTFQVHEFADLAGVTVKALHHYDRLGLLKPARSDAGYRVYTERDLERLEHIVALKFIGLPLRQIKALLDRSWSPLPDTLRMQRMALEERQRRLSLAIRAIENAERAIGTGAQSNALALKTLIGEMGMQDDLEVMEYFGEQAWPEGRRYYERWPSEDWERLYRDIGASLDEHPECDRGQALAARWVALADRDAAGSPEMRAGLWAAWLDREQWPPMLQQKVSALKLDDVTAFIREAVWAFMERQRPAPDASMPPSRVNAERLALFQETVAALGEDPARERAQNLVMRWHALLDAETGGDEETKTTMLKAWETRQSWPSGMRRYVASLYDMPVDTWERVANFIDEAREAHLECT